MKSPIFSQIPDVSEMTRLPILQEHCNGKGMPEELPVDFSPGVYRFSLKTKSEASEKFNY